MRLYLDDCADANLLVALLQDAGHHVVTPPRRVRVGFPIWSTWSTLPSVQWR